MLSGCRCLVLGVAASGLLGGCRLSSDPAPAPLPADGERRIPDVPVYEISPSRGPGADSGGMVIQPAPNRDPLSRLASDKRVTLTTSTADARTLLLWLAQQGGLDLVVSRDVQARVSVSFKDVPVVDAIRAVIAEAGLSVLTADALSPWPPVVFYHLPVDVNQANEDVIVARFGVSREMARWIVESRPRL
jgi:hypothetical protein